MIQRSIIILFFGGIIISGIIYLYHLIYFYVSKNRKFIIESNREMKVSTVKNVYFQEHRMDLLQTLYFMKKYFLYLITIIFIAIIGLGSYLVYDSSEYFRELFEAKRVKLNLAKEEKVDSILTIINIKSTEIDSLVNLVNSKNDIIDLLDKQNKELVKNQKALNYFIEKAKKEEEK
jgi:hypothetical protein